ncbi:hypothetical protein BGI40_03695 [Snodgrassella communis]|uniref:hypothetical protein n=1 Tax=Snodgrassella communis TaxID=2946699 RepID=UPI00056B98F1|nr:hypothetical protein [Snodgrassella communis]PIT10745.1 hypothetical protein BGI29_01425 [Snodgrassella communis]PIT30351.1 hypothetical protein BGI39_00815 [Snodgrassella communis]PIT30379.1 hypothetical protein BGI38_00950 [Snodgrassella communis]PIT34978.1 hypothetical protein BGI40_03695 [Snodgrassella communis]
MNESIDFAQAYHNGLNLIRNRVAEESEIDAVLSRLCDGINTASNGALVCMVGRPYGCDSSERKTVALKRGENRRVRKIFEIELSQGGYPCVVKCGGWHRSVLNKNELETALAEAMQSYSVVSKIYKTLMQIHKDAGA